MGVRGGDSCPLTFDYCQKSLCEVCDCKGTTFGRGQQKKVAHNELFNFLIGVKEVVCGVEVAKDYTRLSR